MIPKIHSSGPGIGALDNRYFRISNNLSEGIAATMRTNLSVYSIAQVDTLLATKQPLDATLTSISALGTAADKMIYTTGVDTWAESAITSFGRSLIDDADSSTARTTLGLVAGGSGDIWVEKAGDTMTGQLYILTTAATTEPLLIDVDQPNGGNSSQFNMNVYTSTQAPAFNFSRAQNTKASPTTLTTGQRVLTMQQLGYNGTAAFQATSQILFEVDGTSGSTLGGRIRMYTATTAGTITEALRIDDDQRVTLNASTATLTIGSSTPSSTEVVSSAITFTNTTGTRKTFDASGTTWSPTANASGQLQAVNAEAVINTTSSGFNFTNTAGGGVGFQGKVTINGTGGNVTAARAGNFLVVNNGAGTDVDTAITVAILAAQNAGVGATMQDVVGLIAAEQTAGAVNNTNVLIGTTTIPTGSFSIYNSSTKDNYFAGDVGIGTTSPTSNFQVSKAGATAAITATSGAVNFDVEAVAGNANMNFIAPAGNQAQMNWYSDTTLRWAMLKTTTAESGSNAGSNYNFIRRQDSGASLGNPVFAIERATGYVGVNRTELSAEYQLDVFGTMRVDGNNLPGTMTLRRADTTVTSGEVLGRVEFMTNDATVTTAVAQTGGYIEVKANAAFTTDAAQSNMHFGTKSTATGAAPDDKLVLTHDGRLYGLFLHDNAGAVTGTTNQYVASGTYTPGLTNVTNIAASTSYKAQWIRVGNVVTVSGKVDIDTTLAAGTASELGIALPIASNLGAENDLGGTATSDAVASETARIKADAANNRASVVFKSISLSNDSYAYIFQYEVI